MRSHLKVYFNFEEDTTALNDSEKGSLLLAMVRYAKDGTESNLTGNERFLFPVFKAQIDRDIETYEVKVNNGSKGGRPKTEQNLKKPNKTENNLTESEKTETPKIEDRRKKIEDKKEKEIKEKEFDRFWSAYPRHENKPKAREAFMKIKPDEELLEKMIASIERWKNSAQWNEDGGKFIPHPSTWLNNQRWEDEPLTQKANSSGRVVVAQQYEQRDYSQQTNPDDVLDRIARLTG